MKHIFVTQDYGPDRGGMARRHVELCRRFTDADNSVGVSTVQLDGASHFDAAESYPIHRQPFSFEQAKRFTNQMRWARWLVDHSRRNRVDVIHCGNIRPVGYGVTWTSRRLRVPYIVYVNGGDLLRERMKTRANPVKRRVARHILGDAAGIAATSSWVAHLTRETMEELGIRVMPPIGAFDLGTDPSMFAPHRDSRRLRSRWGIGDAPVVITVARIVPHKGQDMGIRALAALSDEFPELRYVLVGEGHDAKRLESIAAGLGVSDRVIFAGLLSDSDLADAYATSTVYLGASRVDNEINVEGFGISFLEAAASGLPVVAGDSGGVRSAVRDGETGIVVSPEDTRAIADAVAGFLRDPAQRSRFAAAGRLAVETHYNWDRVARDTLDFTSNAVASWRMRKR